MRECPTNTTPDSRVTGTRRGGIAAIHGAEARSIFTRNAALEGSLFHVRPAGANDTKCLPLREAHNDKWLPHPQAQHERDGTVAVPVTTDDTTVEERRFSAAFARKRPRAFQPPRVTARARSFQKCLTRRFLSRMPTTDDTPDHRCGSQIEPQDRRVKSL